MIRNASRIVLAALAFAVIMTVMDRIGLEPSSGAGPVYAPEAPALPPPPGPPEYERDYGRVNAEPADPLHVRVPGRAVAERAERRLEGETKVEVALGGNTIG